MANVKTNLVSPLLWQSQPTKDETAWQGFLGDHDQWHQLLAKLTKTQWLPLDDLKTSYGLSTHQRMHDAVANALGIPSAGDISSFNLDDPDQFISFMYLNSIDHQRLRLVLGV